MSDISRSEKHATVLREITMRRRVYPRWVEAGRMTQAKATREIDIMVAIAADYEEPSLL